MFGSVLSLYLKIGMTLARFHSFGIVLFIIARSIKQHNGPESSFEQSFSIPGGKLSGPVVFDRFSNSN